MGAGENLPSEPERIELRAMWQRAHSPSGKAAGAVPLSQIAAGVQLWTGPAHGGNIDPDAEIFGALAAEDPSTMKTALAWHGRRQP